MKFRHKISLSKQEQNELREKFIKEYCKKKGWNPNELKTSQMLQIVRQNEYINPILLVN